MTTETKVLIGIGAVTVAILSAGIFFLNKPVPVDLSSVPQVDQKVLIRPDSHQTGPKNAKVTFVEFGDYQCPACGVVYPTVKQLEEEYKGKVNFVFRNYPLPQHNNAMIAAEAAEAAGEQGKYWQMHDKLFSTQGDWSNNSNPLDLFDNYAKDLKLNVDQFTKAVQTNKFNKKISADKQDGVTVNIQYTPSFFINGHLIGGAATYDTLRNAIESQLNSKK
jgi:protein-disulfide isomerase